MPKVQNLSKSSKLVQKSTRLSPELVQKFKINAKEKK